MSNALFQTPHPVNEAVLSYAPNSSEKLAVKQELQRQKTTKATIPAVIGGERLTSGKTFNVVSPHDHQHVLAQCHTVEAKDVAEAIRAAEKARLEWSRMPWQERAAVFLKAADLLAGKYRATMNAATMLGQSKTVHQAEIDASCELIDFFRFNVAFMQEIYSHQPQSMRGVWNRSEARDLEGFVYAIGPFNFTSISVNLCASPALMGCSVLWKPAQTAMLSSYIGLQILEEAGLPPGVINLIPGDARMISETALKHNDLAGIHFTGSTGTFNHLWQQVGQNINNYRSYPRLVGETGGKDFVFAHPSANVDELVVALVRGSFEYQGQKCSASSRAYVPKSLWPAVKEKLVELTNGIKMGNPEDFRNFMGAVIDARAFAKIKGAIDEASKAKDAKIIAGGECDDSVGYFIRPTVIETTNPDYRTMKEELFGPVLTVYPYADQDFDKALDHCANGTPYALTGAIFARDRRVVTALSDKLAYAAGNFYINDKPTGAVVGQQPFGGGRQSGTNDKAGSVFNLLRWVSHRTIKDNFVPITDYTYPFMSEA